MQLFVIRNNADAAAASVAGPLIRSSPAGMQFFFREFLASDFADFVKRSKIKKKNVINLDVLVSRRLVYQHVKLPMQMLLHK